MKGRIKLFTTISIFLLSITVKAFTTLDYYPTELGSVWKYQSSDGVITDTILTEKEYVNGVRTTVSFMSDNSKTFITNDENGLRLHKEESPVEGGVQTVVYNPPVKLADKTIVIGGSSFSQGIATLTDPDLGSLSVNYTYSIRVVGLQDITTTAGLFEQTIHLEQTIRLDGFVYGYRFFSNGTSNAYLAKGIGEVRGEIVSETTIVGIDSQSTSSISELIDITLPQFITPFVLEKDVNTGAKNVYSVSGSSVVSLSQVDSTLNPDWEIVGRGDFNSDGHSDLFWRNRQTGDNHIHLMNGTSRVDNIFVNSVPDTTWGVVGIGDFDGDGFDDILWRNSLNGRVWMYLMNDVTIKDSKHIAYTGASWEIKGTGDFDGNGTADILWRNNQHGRVWMYLMDGKEIDVSKSVAFSGTDWDIQTTGDFNGDGKKDIFWRNSLTGENWMYIMDGWQITKNQGVNTLDDLNWNILDIDTQDFNGDLRDDVLWQNDVTGETVLYRMNGTTVMSASSLVLGETTSTSGQGFRIQMINSSFSDFGVADPFSPEEFEKFLNSE